MRELAIVIDTWKRLRCTYPKLCYRDTPGLKINNRLRSTGGRAFVEYGYIDLNAKFLDHFKDEMHRQIIPHEVAHMAAWYLYADYKHGKGWKDIMISLGLEPLVYHRMGLPK